MPSITQFLLALLIPNLQPALAVNYDLVKDYSGQNFFQDWTFYDHFDNLTNGDTVFVSASVAASSKLAYVDPTTSRAIIKVDNTSIVPFNEKRNTVRITSNDRYGVGSVWVADMFHLPFGCSVWPAWWSQSPNWPQGGEIDTLEGVNLMTNNQMGLHTLPGCTSVGASQASSSHQISTDCSNTTNNNQGCLVADGNAASYGAGFAGAQGGVFVTELATTGISIWFFPRANVPASITPSSKNIDTSTLGAPTANFPSTGCPMDKFFEPQNLIFDITLCGDFAGAPTIFSQTCSGTCYNDWVVGNGSDYLNAYFDIAYVHVFSSNGTNNIIKGGGGNNGGNGNSSGNGNSNGNGNSGGNSNSSNHGRYLSAGAVAFFFAAVAVILA